MLSVPHVHGFYPNLQSTLPFLTCSCSSRTPKCAFDDSMVQRCKGSPTGWWGAVNQTFIVVRALLQSHDLWIEHAAQFRCIFFPILPLIKG